MSTLKSYTGPTKLVLAFDIGTTFSGVSYCVLEPGKVPEVLAVTQFPGQEKAGADASAKVPSLLLYEKNDEKNDEKSGTFKAGYEVPPESDIETASKEGMAEFWMLRLHPTFSSINEDDFRPLPQTPEKKSAVDVLTDFVGYLYMHVVEYIRKLHPAIANLQTDVRESTEYIFTHPNGWRVDEQQRYHRAIERAGLILNTIVGHSRVHFLTACEAGLHSYIRTLPADHTATKRVLVVDAGGGTIDLSVFSTTFNPISCKEIAPTECLVKGSIFVTRRAGDLLKKKLEGSEYSKPEEIDRITREFDRATKHFIKSDQEASYVRVAGRRYNNPKYSIVFGKLKLAGEEATGLFNDCHYPIITTVEQQLESVKTPITMAYFVGGLTTNEWLWSRLQSYFKGKDINLDRPPLDDINMAVANGAVWSHILHENHLNPTRVAAATYGVVCSVPDSTLKEEDKNREDPVFFKPILCKGSPVGEKMEYKFQFSLDESDPANFGPQTVRLVCYRGSKQDIRWVNDDPTWFSTFCTIKADLSKPAKEVFPEKVPDQDCYHLDYDVMVYFEATKLRAKLFWKIDDEPRDADAEVAYDALALSSIEFQV